jgi:hypothetical protein
MTTQVTDTDEDGHGFGTMVADLDGVSIVGHGGDGIQYSPILLVWPSTRTAAVLPSPAPGLSAGDGARLPGWALALCQQLPHG